MAPAAGIEPASYFRTLVNSEAHHLDAGPELNKWCGLRDSNSRRTVWKTDILPLNEARTESRRAPPACAAHVLKKPELLNNSGGWISGEVRAELALEVFSSPGMAPGATQESATDFQISFAAMPRPESCRLITEIGELRFHCGRDGTPEIVTNATTSRTMCRAHHPSLRFCCRFRAC